MGDEHRTLTDEEIEATGRIRSETMPGDDADGDDDDANDADDADQDADLDDPS